MQKFDNIDTLLSVAQEYDSKIKPYLEHIDSFKSLENLSGAEDEIVICQESLDNAKKFIVMLNYSGCILPNLDDDIYPTHYGTVTMDFYLTGLEHISLEIGKDGYGYYNNFEYTAENTSFDFTYVPKELFEKLYRKPSKELCGVTQLRYTQRSIEHAIHCLNVLSDIAEAMPEEVPDDIEDFVDEHFGVMRNLSDKIDELLRKYSVDEREEAVKDFSQEYDKSLDDYPENNI